MSEPKSREGTQFGPYRLLRLIGKGGMGEVYEAEDTVKDRIVALKLLPEGVSHDPVFRKRLQREAHSAGRLQEPHVVPIHDYGEIDGVLYVDMRMINGSDLRKILKNFGPDDACAGGCHRAPDRVGPRRRARGRHHAPRRQAREHPDHPRRLRVPGGLRHRQRGQRREADRAGHRGRHLRLHGARAVHQRRGHLPRRHLCAGVRAARMPHRVAALRRRQRQRGHHRPPDAADPPARARAPRHPGGVRPGDRAGHGQEARRALRHRGRSGEGGHRGADRPRPGPGGDHPAARRGGDDAEQAIRPGHDRRAPTRWPTTVRGHAATRRTHRRSAPRRHRSEPHANAVRRRPYATAALRGASPAAYGGTPAPFAARRHRRLSSTGSPGRPRRHRPARAVRPGLRLPARVRRAATRCRGFRSPQWQASSCCCLRRRDLPARQARRPTAPRARR